MKVNNAFESELQSILIAMQHGHIRGIQKLVVEGDCKKAIDILNNRRLQFDAYNWVRDIKWWKEQFEDVKFI